MTLFLIQISKKWSSSYKRNFDSKILHILYKIKQYVRMYGFEIKQRVEPSLFEMGREDTEISWNSLGIFGILRLRNFPVFAAMCRREKGTANIFFILAREERRNKK